MGEGMVGEEFAWNMLKKGLGLTDDDVQELKDGVMSFKELGPTYLARAEATEKRVLAISYFLKEQNRELWERAEQMAQQYFARRALVDEKSKRKPASAEKT